MTIHAAIFAPMTNLREQQLAWLDNVQETTGLTPTEIARVSDLVPSTLTRFRSKDTDGHTLTARSVKKIEKATGVPAYETRKRATLMSFNEEEGLPYVFGSDNVGTLEQALRILVQKSNSVDLWTLKSPYLAAVGYHAGDVVIVDRDAKPVTGDCVVAQKYDFRSGTAETIFRVLRSPYLVGAPQRGEPPMPEIVDNENVVIKGVLKGSCHLP